jgi:hypothetical protein
MGRQAHERYQWSSHSAELNRRSRVSGLEFIGNRPARVRELPLTIKVPLPYGYGDIFSVAQRAFAEMQRLANVHWCSRTRGYSEWRR